ncbi:terpenoid cyclases/Protein prenyltransferase [Serendipita vermifera]|nr:terpenoid cyclases/Protein prenyltransferase [Serendipita vermifera]
MSQNDAATIVPKGHLASATRFLRQGLPPSAIDNDQARLVVSFYCLATLDVLGAVESSTKEWERAEWRSWLWAQQVSGSWGAGFRGSPSINQSSSPYDPPFLIMTYAAILCLAILRDPFDNLDRQGLLQYLKVSQREDGSFRLNPSSDECDLRMTYCAFVICSVLGEWSCINVERAVEFIQRCRSYEGGYGQEPGNEAQGGSTYCALASLHLLPSTYPDPLTDKDRDTTLRWLLYAQQAGFCGRTNKHQDACYCFWCGASVAILGKAHLVDRQANVDFLSSCQFKYGGISKEPGERPDPYHTYLALASLAILSKEELSFPAALDSLWNTTDPTKAWLKEKLSSRE